jgi:diaminohydroxyphosphoribosylaminopyrimidine deaminase / 5-amino-6-(5-phosphoribosylamino)uracil reductase
MARALALAVRAGRAVRPNPRVGAVLVKDGEVIAAGYHSRFGGPHAEARVLKKAGGAARGGTLYVSLEPCSTRGKTSPCTKAIISSGVKRVVIGCRDRNPENGGRAAGILKKAGIAVTIGVREEEAHDINKDFFIWVTEDRPYTTLKLALSLDGRITTRTGDSRWISSLPSRKFVHRLRSLSDAVLVGAKTVMRDDPLLTARMGFRHPGLKRVILEGRSRIPLSSRLLSGKAGPGVILASGSPVSKPRLKKLAARGITCLEFPSRAGRVNLRPLFQVLAERGVMRLLVEGGGETAGALFEAGLVDEVHLFIAPVIIGGRRAAPAVGGRGAELVKEALHLENPRIEELGGDIHVSGRIAR